MTQYRSYRGEVTPIVKNLIIINALIWFASSILDTRFPFAFDDRFPISTFGNLWALAPSSFYPHYFEPYQLVSYMFFHASGFNNIGHVFFNMLILFFVGRRLEAHWGPKRFLIFYLACGLGAGILHTIIQYITGGYGSMVGASGAVMGVTVAFAYLFPNTEIVVFPIPIPIKVKYIAMLIVARDLYDGLVDRGDQVAHFAHLGGAITGFLIVYIWNKTNKKTFY